MPALEENRTIHLIRKTEDQRKFLDLSLQHAGLMIRSRDDSLASRDVAKPDVLFHRCSRICISISKSLRTRLAVGI